jgi:hypothetical protein
VSPLGAPRLGILDGLILRHLVACATAQPNAIAAELIPAVHRRIRAAPPARTAAVPLVVLHLISLLGDDVTPGRATRVRTAQSDARQRIRATVL